MCIVNATQLMQQIEDIYSAGFDADTTKQFLRKIAVWMVENDRADAVYEQAVYERFELLHEQLVEARGRLDKLEAAERSRQGSTLFPDM